MRLLGNIIWFIFGGFLASLLWFIFGILLSLTILGIPLGKQCFKFATLVMFPFGKDVDIHFEKHPLANLLWAVFFGWEMLLGYLGIALAYAVTIIGIPFAVQWVKLGKLALLPFGAKIK